MSTEHDIVEVGKKYAGPVLTGAALMFALHGEAQAKDNGMDQVLNTSNSIVVESLPQATGELAKVPTQSLESYEGKTFPGKEFPTLKAIPLSVLYAQKELDHLNERLSVDDYRTEVGSNNAVENLVSAYQNLASEMNMGGVDIGVTVLLDKEGKPFAVVDMGVASVSLQAQDGSAFATSNSETSKVDLLLPTDNVVFQLQQPEGPVQIKLRLVESPEGNTQALPTVEVENGDSIEIWGFLTDGTNLYQELLETVKKEDRVVREGNINELIGGSQIKTEPNDTSGNVGNITSNMKFTILEESGGWSRIQTESGGYEGWVKTNYIVLSQIEHPFDPSLYTADRTVNSKVPVFPTPTESVTANDASMEIIHYGEGLAKYPEGTTAAAEISFDGRNINISTNIPEYADLFNYLNVDQFKTNISPLYGTVLNPSETYNVQLIDIANAESFIKEHTLIDYTEFPHNGNNLVDFALFEPEQVPNTNTYNIFVLVNPAGVDRFDANSVLNFGGQDSRRGDYYLSSIIGGALTTRTIGRSYEDHRQIYTDDLSNPVPFLNYFSNSPQHALQTQ